MKKLLAIALASLMVFSLMIPVKAAKEDSAKLEELMKLTKKIFSIANDFDDISTSVKDDSYSIVWAYKDEKKSERVRVQYDKKGNLIDFYNYMNTDAKTKSVINRTDAEKLATKTLNALYPKKAYDFYLTDIQATGETFTCEFGYKYKDLPIYMAKIYVEVNSKNGKIRSVYSQSLGRLINDIDFKDLEFKNPADKSYEKMLEANPLYLFLERNDEDKLYPYYSFLNTTPIIDANTLELLDMPMYFGYGAAEGAKDMNAMDSLNKEEVKELDKVKNLKSKDQAIKKAQDFFNIKYNKTKYLNLWKNAISDKYEYNIEFDTDKDSKEYISAGIRANDLLPLSYHKNVYEEPGKAAKVDSKKAADFIEKFNKKLGLNYDMLIENTSDYNVSREYYKKRDEYYLKNENYTLMANDKFLTDYTLNLSKDDTTAPYTKKKIDQKAAEADIKDKGKWQKVIYVETYRDDDQGPNNKVKGIKAAYAFMEKINPYDAVTGDFKTYDYKKPLVEPSGDMPKDLVDIIDAGFGVASEKSYDDYFDYKDLLLNIYKLANDFVPDLDKTLEDLAFTKVFDEKKLDANIPSGQIFRAYYKAKLDLSDELDATYFAKTNEDAKFASYLQIARASKIIDKSYKATDKIKVKDALKIISKIYFK